MDRPLGARAKWSMAAVLCLALLYFLSGGTAAMGATAEADARLMNFIQKRFRIADPAQITLGPANESGIPGVLARQVTVAGEKGATARVSIFTDPQEDKFIVGQLFDTAQDPWGRVNVASVHLADRPALGPAEAPVTLIEFADFECPHCAHAFDELETALHNTYKDRVRMVFKNFPLSGHKWARDAAVAAECARLQNPDAFWDFAREFYHDQVQINATNLREHIDASAVKLKLDKDVLGACLTSKAAQDRVAQDVADGQAIHVTSTPTIIINGIAIVGSPDDRLLGFVLDSELKQPRKPQ